MARPGWMAKGCPASSPFSSAASSGSFALSSGRHASADSLSSSLTVGLGIWAHHLYMYVYIYIYIYIQTKINNIYLYIYLYIYIYIRICPFRDYINYLIPPNSPTNPTASSRKSSVKCWQKLFRSREQPLPCFWIMSANLARKPNSSSSFLGRPTLGFRV